MMVCSGPRGFTPLSAYARRAPEPLGSNARASRRLRTNLSYKDPSGGWGNDTSRLIPLGEDQFGSLGLGLEDMVDAYIQTVLSVVAIEQMSESLVDGQGNFAVERFQALNGDLSLMREIPALSEDPLFQPQL
jgi:hypothetical protein